VATFAIAGMIAGENLGLKAVLGLVALVAAAVAWNVALYRHRR
jgi:hypothetical protein